MKTKEFEKVIAEELKDLSFSKKKYHFDKQFGERTIGTVGFMIASQLVPGTLFINPIIGVHDLPVEELCCKLLGWKPMEVKNATITSPLGYLLPSNDYTEWEISDTCNLSVVIEDMIEKIKIYGFSFIEKYQDPNELLKCLGERKYILNTSRIYKLPVMYYLLGYKDKAIEFVEEVSSNYKDKNNVDAERYLGFAQKFRELMKETS